MEIKKIVSGLVSAGLTAIAGWYGGVVIDALANIAHVAVQFGTSNAPLVLAIIGGTVGVMEMLK